MVAFTSTFALPYQQSTDRPCDAPEVWCDFTNNLDGRLFGFDQTLGRLTPTIPMAKVLVTIPFTLFGTNTVIEFDTVEFDTDNMVDLDRTNSRIVPRRFGTYYCVATGEASGGGAGAGNPLELFIADGFAGPLSGGGFVPGSNTEDALRTFNPADYKIRVSAPFVWDASSTFGIGVVILLVGALTITFTRIDLSVYWISDRTT